MASWIVAVRWSIVGALGVGLCGATLSCFEAEVPNCTVSCSSDNDCPAGLGCSTEGLCATSEDACTVPITCTANEFRSCVDGETLERCNATGDGTMTETCGAAGCNAARGACNACAPDELRCSATNPAVIERCAADGAAFTDDQLCAHQCVAGTDTVATHCSYLEPLYLPDICDMPAATPSILYSTSGTIDTAVATSCDQVVTQMAGPEICVIRAGTIEVMAGRTMTFTGARALALVADASLTIAGTIDVAAEGTTNGPGGGFVRSGAVQSGASGGGGAGFKSAGGNGGGSAGAGTGSAGGAPTNPLLLNSLVGGTRQNTSLMLISAVPGGGGGALNLIACRGTVTVSGVIDAGGGGATGGRDQIAGLQVSFVSAAGGGSGGQVLMQGLQVIVTNTAQTYANGGGGGGGTATNDTTGGSGTDGLRSTSCASGGVGAAAPSGGSGACQGTAAQNGGGGNGSSNGGGGGLGYFWVYAPAGVTPTITPGSSSPTIDPRRTAMTR